jgi:hypothetical protein
MIVDILKCRIFDGIGDTYNAVVNTYSGATISFLVPRRLVTLTDKDRDEVEKSHHDDPVEVYGDITICVDLVDFDNKRVFLSLPGVVGGSIWVDLNSVVFDQPDAFEEVVEISGQIVTIEPVELPPSPLEGRQRKQLT